MGKYIINGGHKLNGEININGAKNSALPILAASILNEGVSVIQNCPKISDTFIAIEILKELGCKVNIEDNTIIIDSSFINKNELSDNLTKKMRSSMIFLGSILGRLKKAKLCYPGRYEL